MAAAARDDPCIREANGASLPRVARPWHVYSPNLFSARCLWRLAMACGSEGLRPAASNSGLEPTSSGALTALLGREILRGGTQARRPRRALEPAVE